MLFSKKADAQHMGPLIDKALLSGDIICTFFSGKEIGPRALGNRSILCAANQPKTVTELNNKIKKREFFRPLAPIMLEETAQKYFLLPYLHFTFEHVQMDPCSYLVTISHNKYV